MIRCSFDFHSFDLDLDLDLDLIWIWIWIWIGSSVGSLMSRTGLRARLSTVYSALNTYGLPTQEESPKIENFDSMLNVEEGEEESDE